MVCAIIAYCNRYNPAVDGCLEALTINDEVFTSQSSFPAAAFARWIGSISRTCAEFRQLLSDARPYSLLNDCTLHYKFPLIEIAPNRHVCTDVGMLARQLTEGTYWLTFEALPDAASRESFRRIFGQVYARYIGRLLTSVYGTGTLSCLRLEVMFRDHSEFCDALIDVGDATVLLEFKASLIRPAARYSGDVDVLMQELEDKFVVHHRSDRDVPIGVGQLAHNARKFLKDDLPVSAPHLTETRSRPIFPVLVCFDTAVATPFLNEYLDGRLRERMDVEGLDRSALRPLTLMTTEDVERLTAVTGGSSLPDMLRDFHANRYAHATFGNYLSTLPQGLQADLTPIHAQFKELYAIAGQLLFPAEPIGTV